MALNKPGEDTLEENVTSLRGLRVVALESRMSDQTSILIERTGGICVKAPSLREIPLENNETAFEFAEKLNEAQYDIVIFLTGVGCKLLSQAIETKIPAETWLASLSKTVVVARGPKPLVVLRGWGVTVDIQIPEPNTWRDIVEALDKNCPVEGKSIAIQEYGQSNLDLIEALIQRGARAVQSVPVYRWALPEDLEPLRSSIVQMIEGRIGALVVTSAQQIRHLFQVAEQHQLAQDLLKVLNEKVIVASVGPIATETLVEYGIVPDIEPVHPKLGPLIQSLAKEWPQSKKKPGREAFGN